MIRRAICGWLGHKPPRYVNALPYICRSCGKSTYH